MALSLLAMSFAVLLYDLGERSHEHAVYKGILLPVAEISHAKMSAALDVNQGRGTHLAQVLL
jgi:hypothetical protein